MQSYIMLPYLQAILYGRLDVHQKAAHELGSLLTASKMEAAGYTDDEQCWLFLSSLDAYDRRTQSLIALNQFAEANQASTYWACCLTITAHCFMHR